MKSCYAYIRVSTVKQGEQGCSLDEQRAAIEAFATRHGITIARWFEEMETAAKRGRPQFAELTRLLRGGGADGLVLHKIDRGARNLKDWADLGELIDAGVEIHFAHEGLDMTTRGGRLAADIQAVVASDYIRNLRDEVKKGFYGRLKQGLYPLPAPRGYRNHGKGQPKTIDPVTGPLVHYAFERYASGSVSIDGLRHDLAERGLTGPGGKQMTSNGLSILLRNPFYIGMIRLKRTGEVFPGIHEPLIDQALFDRVQAIMDGRLYPRVQSHQYTFRRLIRCAACGRSLTGERQKGHIYYRCHERACRGTSISERSIEAFIEAELRELVLPDEGLGDLRDLFESLIEEERADTGTRAEHTRRDLALVVQRIERLTDALIDGTIDAATFNERKAGLLADRLRLEHSLQKGTDWTFWQDVAQWFELGNAAQMRYFSADPEEKRDLLKILGSNLVAEGKSLEFPMFFPWNEIRSWSKTDCGGPYQGAVRTQGVHAALIDAIGKHRDHAHDPIRRCVNVPEQVPQVPKSPPATTGATGDAVR